jgi:large subunit ribosomal protein L15
LKLHDLKPAPGSRKDRTRVGRGIAAGKGKTAGRGTKGQKARAGASIPAWFEGGQTPLHMRVPKLRGFKRRGRVEFQVVNVGRISDYAAAGRFGVEAEGSATRGKGGPQPITVNVEVLDRAGLVGSTRLPVKILGTGEVTARLFVAADAFTRSAREKIEAAGGFVQSLAPAKPVPEAEDVVAETAASEEPKEPPAPKRRTRRTSQPTEAAQPSDPAEPTED